MKFYTLSFLLTAFYCTLSLVLSEDYAPYGTDCLDLYKYTGGWFEIATSDYVSKTIEYGCKCSSVYYQLNSINTTFLDISNTCYLDQYTQFNVTAKAYQTEPVANPARLYVDIDWNIHDDYIANSTKANYIVLRVYSNENGDYQSAIVGGNNDNTFWFISRTPTIEQKNLDDMIHVTSSYGYNTSNIHYTEQNLFWCRPLASSLRPESE